MDIPLKEPLIDPHPTGFMVKSTQGFLRHGVLIHLRTPWDALFSMLVRKRVLVLIALVALGTTLRPKVLIPCGRGAVCAWSALCQSAFMGLILVSQLVAKWRANHGKGFAAHVIFVPAFETLLWMLFSLTLIDLNIMSEASPNYPHFMEVYYNRAGPMRASDPVLYCIHTFLDCQIQIWFIPCLFSQHTLSRRAIRSALRNSMLLSVATALVCTFGYLCEVLWSLTDLSVVIMCTSKDLLAIVVSCWLGYKAIFSSRKSILPFAAISIISCILGAIVSITRLDSVSNGYRDPFIIAFVIFNCIVFNIALFWTLFLDTVYWRGATRIPIWCARADFSPYGQIADKLIQKQIPILVDRPTLEFIDFAFLQFGDLLGAGSTSQVFKGKICFGRHAGKEVAIKVFTPLEISGETLGEFANEIHKFQHLNHERLMQLVGVCICPPDICMVCEYCAGGSLFDYVRKNTLTTAEKMRLSTQVCEAVAYIHDITPPLIHRDLKSQNFLLTADRNVKLADFGTSVEWVDGRERTMSTRIGSLAWMSPEVLRGSDRYDLKADIYSLGVVLWEIWAQREPHEGVHASKIQANVLGGHHLKTPQSCPPAVSFLIESMWNSDPNARPSATQAFEALVMLS